MAPTLITPNPDLWGEVITKLQSKLRRRQNSIQIKMIHSKSTLERIKSKVSLHQTNGMFRFATLPRKIRLQIYKELFNITMPSHLVVRDPVYQTSYPRDTFPRPLPALCYTNRQIYNECTAIALRGRHIILTDLCAAKVLCDFLSCASNDTFRSGIRSISFGSHINWQPFATHTVRDLLSKCFNLRHVRIEVTPSACVQYELDDSFGGGSFHLRRKKHIVEQMDLCCLLECRKLRTLTLMCMDGESYARRMGLRVDDIFKLLVIWVQQNICASGKVRLGVEYELWSRLFGRD
jgi:hypothetical protein